MSKKRRKPGRPARETNEGRVPMIATIRDAPAAQAATEPPLLGHWHGGNGVLCCGTLRVFGEDFDTDPAPEFKEHLLTWVCDTLNAAQDAYRAAQQVQADARGEVVITWDEGQTKILAVTRQDDEGQILSIIAEAPAKQAQADAGAVLVSHADLEAINAAMQHLGDVLNGMDAVEAEDEEKTDAGFEAISRILAAHPSPAAESDKRDSEHADVGRLLHKAACELPDGWEIQVRVERGWGGVVVHDEAGETTDLDDGESSMSEQIERAIRAAMSREQSGDDRG